MTLAERLGEEPYAGYAYGYPHKTAYRPLAPREHLRQVWADDAKEALTLYVHVPICEMRCGFCNLFTMRGEGPDFEELYLPALERQTERVLAQLGPHRFRAGVVGGGTPTQLSPAGLTRVLELLRRAGAGADQVPVSVETSPRTADAERLDILRAAGVTRLSIGVQSFIDEETRSLGRPQQRAWVESALERIRARGFPVLNVDLIYGAVGQTEASFLASIDAALRYAPDELYLYPLYVRPLTGLGKRSPNRETTARLRLYRSARERLLSAGYEQVSMRFFRKPAVPSFADTCCQEDGTIGVGCGARSYTQRLHYSFEWAVGQEAVRSIVTDYAQATDETFEHALHGVWLDVEEQRRRYVIKTLLRSEGLSLLRYARFFGSSALRDLPQLGELCAAGLAEERDDQLRLSPHGLELSDAIGPYLYSPAMTERMAGFGLR